MYSTHEPNSFEEQKSNFLFSFIFALFFLLVVQLVSIFTFLYNLIIFPFTVIHELSHCIALSWFFPGKDQPQVEFHLLENGISSANVKFESFPICWESIISFFIGPISVLLICVIGIIVIHKYSSSSLIGKAGNQFLMFIVLCDIPNLFPIHPPLIGAATDGYAVSVYLFLMGYIPFVSSELSLIFYGIASIIAFTAFFYLGSTVYFLLLQSKISILNHSRGFQPQSS